MERDFYTDEFEDLIKEKSDQYRMYPSDKVWKGIKRSLHSHKKRYWFGFALLLTGLSYYGIDQLIFSEPEKHTSNSVPKTPSTEKQPAKIVPFTQVSPGSLNRERPDLNLVKPFPGTTADQPESEFDAPPVNGDSKTLTMVKDQGPTYMKDEEPTYKESEVSTVRPLFPQEVIQTQAPIVGTEAHFNTVIIPGVQTKPESEAEEDIMKINWLQDHAVYSLVISKPKRINWQLSFAPTMNYRKLTGTKNANIQSSSRNIPIALNIQGDVDKLVNHKPALGFELGSYLLYSINHNFSLKAGLQFNYSRYQIQAYSSATERATISLNSINGLSSSSISNYTQIRNFGGYAVQNLQNQYFQLSVPLGIELNILGNNKLQLGVAGTVQPTYLLNPNTYLISSDYKNYTKEPSLIRRWNVNTSAETFVSYKTAGLKWQVGPQIRYQLFSSYRNKYPIKEYLIEYGVKIGVTKTIR
jgi:hypothetical protein